MASYMTLGSRSAIGAPDMTQNNPGNWTVVFDSQILAVKAAFFEVYKMVVAGANNSSFDVAVDQNKWDTSIMGDKNAWDPNQPLIMSPGQTLYFYWSDPVTDNSPPIVTIWLRYDTELAINQSTVQQGA